MEYSILNDYVYENKPFFLKRCDWLSYPLRVALGGKTIEYPSGREVQDSRIIAIALCCLVVPAIVGTMCLLLKFITKFRLLKSLSHPRMSFGGHDKRGQAPLKPPSLSS
jgi:hypothetical protein